MQCQISEAAIVDTKRRKIHLSVKLLYTLFLAVLVPSYWRDYGPTNFQYFCDVALFFTLIGVWTEQPVWASAASVGILLPQAVWMIDFLATLFGIPVMGMTQYMFDPQIPLSTRILSSFHFWLPILLIYLTFRLGYDRRALACWTILSLILLPACYFLLPAPPPSTEHPNIPVNINYVHGFSDNAPQQWMNQGLWLGTLMIGLPLLVYWPTHRLLTWKRLGVRIYQGR
jgi:hypothetical protein